jgi:hypothetical protein
LIFAICPHVRSFLFFSGCESLFTERYCKGDVGLL